MKNLHYGSKRYSDILPSRIICKGIEGPRPSEGVNVDQKDGENLPPEQTAMSNRQRSDFLEKRIAALEKRGAARGEKVQTAVGKYKEKIAKAKGVKLKPDHNKIITGTLGALQENDDAGSVTPNSTEDGSNNSEVFVQTGGYQPDSPADAQQDIQQGDIPQTDKENALSAPLILPKEVSVAPVELIAAAEPVVEVTSAHVTSTQDLNSESGEKNMENLVATLEKNIQSAKESLANHMAKFESTIPDNNFMIRGKLQESFEESRAAIESMVKNVEELLIAAKAQAKSGDYKTALQNYKNLGDVMHSLFEAGKKSQSGEFLLANSTKETLRAMRSDAAARMPDFDSALNNLQNKLQNS